MLPTHVRTGTNTDLRRDDPGEADALLVARAKLGDGRAFAHLYRRYVERIYAFTARRLGSRPAAEEATQEIFTRALAGLGRCRDDAFPSWLFAIARHAVVEQQRSARRDAYTVAGVPEGEDAGLTPEEYAVRTEAARELRAARERCLTAKEGELLDLVLADLSDREIGAALGRRRGAVRTAQWRLMIKLRDCFGIRQPATGGRHVAG